MKTPTRSRSSSGSSKECINNSLEVSLPALKASRYCDTPFLLGPVLSLALTDSSAYFFSASFVHCKGFPSTRSCPPLRKKPLSFSSDSLCQRFVPEELEHLLNQVLQAKTS